MSGTALSRLKYGASTFLLVAFANIASEHAALAQAAAQGDTSGTEEVTVTGTSIRGIAPVGANLVSVGRAEIDETAAQTVNQILKQVPAFSNYGSASGTGTINPAIHNLGAASSYSTLVLIDGHRFALGGTTQTLPDAGILPPSAIERVDVLADAASSTYGSDAVAGVVNLITRTDYSGFEASIQQGMGNHYTTRAATVLGGATFEHGGYIMATVAYSFSGGPQLAKYRPYLDPNQTVHGGSNGDTFNCDPAALKIGGSEYIGNSATTPTTVPFCNQNYLANVSRTVRTNGMLKAGYDVSSKFKLSADVNISDLHTKANVSRGNISGVTAFMAGSTPASPATAAQDNPFYTVNPAGYTGTATTESINFDTNNLLGPGAYTYNDSLNIFINGNAEYDITDNWRVTFMMMYGIEDDEQASYGTLCSSCVNLALNGTTNAGGNPTTPSIFGTSVVALNTPLTTANALDVWNPGSSNKTSAATLASLTNNNQLGAQYYATSQYRLGTDGKIFQLPGGDVSAAAGVEYVRYNVELDQTKPNNTGPSGTGSTFLSIPLQRHVSSAFAEVVVPIFGEGNAIPFFQKLTFNASVRYDRYNDIGSTTNPKVGMDWRISDDIKLRADYATSFVAPQLSTVGDRNNGGFNNFTCYGNACPAGGVNVNSGVMNVPVASFPSVVGLPLSNSGGTRTGAFCLATATTCIIAGTDGTIYNGGPANPKPSTAVNFSIGADITPTFLPGLTISATLFDVRYIKFITGTSMANALNSPSLNLINFFPAGATQADLNTILPAHAILTGSLPATIYYLVSGRQGNFNNVSTQGIDAQVDYTIPTDGWGTFDAGFGLTQFLRFKQHLVGGQAFYSILNTVGVNSTFGAVATNARFHLGWQYEAFGADLFDVFVGSYHNWGTPKIPIIARADGAPIGGGDVVAAHHNFELNLRYTLPNEGILSADGYLAGDTLFVDATNLFNTEPPFFFNSSGYDSSNADITGRVVTVGLRIKM